MKTKRVVWFAFFLSAIVVWLTPAVAYLQGAAGAVNVISVNPKAFPNIEMILTVLDGNGMLIPNLTTADFQILEDSRPVTAAQVQMFHSPDAPIALCLAIDVSGSMVGQPIENAKSSARTFVDSLGPKDQAAIVAFSDQVDINTPLVINPARETPLTSDKNLLKNLIDTLASDTKPGTPLYDAAVKCVKLVAQSTNTRAVILFTDGKDEKLDEKTNKIMPGSVSTADRPVTAAREAHLPIFTIGLGNEIDARYLLRLAEETGGTYQKVEAAGELTALFQKIANQLKTQYNVKYASQLFPDGKDHALQIRVRTPAGSVETPATLNLPRNVVNKPFIRLYYTEGDERKDLKDGQKIKGTVTLAPQIATGGVLSYTAFLVDNSPVYTATVAPYQFDWNTNNPPFGGHQLTVRAQDDKGQVSEASVRVETLELSLTEVVADLPIIMKVGIAAGLLFVLFAVIGLIVFLASRKPPRLCPRGLHPMPPGATVCSFCQAEDATQGQPSVYPINQVDIESPPIPFGRTEALPSGDTDTSAPPATIVLKKPPVSIAFLVIEEGAPVGKEFRLLADTSLGRAATNDIVIDDPAVSRNQAKVKAEGKEFYLYDLASTNPTLVNDKAIRGRRKLIEDDRIQMGNTVLVFKRVQA